MLAIAHPLALPKAGELPFPVKVTMRPGEARQLAREAPDGVLAVGGDGTIFEIVNGLVEAGHKGPLAIAPFGSGNDTARSLGITRRNWREKLQRGVVKRLDLGYLQPANAYPVHFLGCASLGFAATVTAQAARLPRGLPGLYAVATLLALPRVRRHPAWLTTEDDAVPAQLLNVNLANLRYFGGGMTAAPKADASDGMLDMVLMECGLLDVIRHLPRLFTGDFDVPKVTQRRFSWLRVDCEVPLQIQIDGEVLGTTPAECRVVPRALDVVC